MKNLMLCAVSTLAMAWGQPVLGQSAGSAEGQGSEARETGLADIVVTATRRATNLQDTPISISALDADLLEQRGLEDAAELSRTIPNTRFERAQGAYGPGMTAYIRGIGQADTSLASEPAVAFYVDDVYYPLLFGSLIDLLDLERVEVLRGPQGTLFGRNALAGAVNLVTRRPQLNESSGYGQFTIGSYQRREFRANVNIPVGDTVAFSFSGLSKQRQGHQKRLDYRCEMVRQGTPELAGNFPFYSPETLNKAITGDRNDCVIGHLGGDDVQAVRGQVYWEPSSRFNATISADYLADDSEAAMDSVVEIDPVIGASRQAVNSVFDLYSRPGETPFRYDQRFLTGNPYTTYVNFSDTVRAGEQIPGNVVYNGSPFRGGVVNPSTVPVRSWGISSRFVYELADDIELVGAFGYRDFRATYGFDNDGTPLNVQNDRNDVVHQNFSGEVRIAGTRQWIDWVAGIFYYTGHGSQRFSGTSPFNGTVRYTANFYDPDSKAAFANLTLRPLNRLSVVLGGRYSDEIKKVDNFNALDNTTAASTEVTFDPSSATIFLLDIKSRRFDWKAGLNFELADRTLVYGSVSTGAKLPGFNARPLQPSQVGQYPGDEVVSYELGIKTDLFERKVRVNAAAFYSDYKNRPSGLSGQEYQVGSNGQPLPGNQIQIPMAVNPEFTTCRSRTTQEIASNVPGFMCIGRSYSQNIPGKIKGFEVEVDLRPVPELSINATVGYHKFSAPDLDARPDGANKRLTGIPEWTANAGIQYRIDTPALAGTVTPRLDWFYTGSQVYDALRTDYNQPGYSLVNARLTYDNEEYDFSVSAGATNLFNKFYWRNYMIYQSLGRPQNNGQPGSPREFYLTVNKRF